LSERITQPIASSSWEQYNGPLHLETNPCLPPEPDRKKRRSP
jgi:hypothetical protein